MNAATRDFVRQRARERCEYCRLHQRHSELAHHVEHIVARSHGGSSSPENLALSCHRCNLHKGPNLSGIDPETGELVPLFHPRQDHWTEHFFYEDVRIEGITATGRATVQVLAMNDARRLDIRRELLQRGELT
jgi:hypothetical protein